MRAAGRPRVAVVRPYEEDIIIMGRCTAKVRVTALPLAQVDASRAAAAARELAAEAAAALQ